MKKEIILIISLIILLTNLNLIMAEEYCFMKIRGGERVHINENDYYICNHPPSWTCQICVSESNKWYAPWPRCSHTCVFDDNESEPDFQMNVDFPFQNNAVLQRQSFYLNISTNKAATIYLVNNIENGEKILCSNCNSYKRSISFSEGLNNITIKAISGLGIEEDNIKFTVDSKKPVIKKTEPKNNKFADGNFTITYAEDNPSSVVLNYGNNITGYRNALLSGCIGGKKESCSIDINLGDYDGQEIEYLFNITDIAGNSVQKRPVKVKVDITAPVINYFNYNINGKYVTFNMSVSELNFDSVEYIDNLETSPRWRTLCTRLKEGSCIKRVSFRTGQHNLDIQVTDKAGNAVGQNIGFVI